MCGGGGGDRRQDIKDLVTLEGKSQKIKKSKIRKIRHAQRIKINGKKKRCVCIDIENERERKNWAVWWAVGDMVEVLGQYRGRFGRYGSQ